MNIRDVLVILAAICLAVGTFLLFGLTDDGDLNEDAHGWIGLGLLLYVTSHINFGRYHR